jgi:predicted nucleic acid-binding protein
MASDAIIVDTGVIFAVADSSDADHDACEELLASFAGELVVPTPVIVETSWLIESRLGTGAEARFLRAVTSGELHRHDLGDADWERVLALVEAYADLGLGLVDASVVAVAEHLGASAVATLNHRDFSVVRPRHLKAFELLP